MAPIRNEEDIRLGILNTLLTCPHRDLGSIYGVHAELQKQDPRFYVRLAAWYSDTGSVRDHKEMFSAALILSDDETHREVGLAMLRRMPPYEVARVVDFIHGRVERRKVRVTPDAERKAGLRERVRGVIRGKRQGRKAEKPVAATRVEVQEKIEKVGLFKNLPRSLKTEVTRYLREREAKPEWFDECAVMARKQMKRLYAVMHIEPSARAQAILFDDEPPLDSKLHQLKTLARAESPVEQARAIVEHRIPYRIASSVVRNMTPAVLVALVDAMTPQELINNLASLKRRGALDNPELKVMVEAKLGRAKSDKRVSAYKAKEAAKAAGLSEDLEAKLDEVTEAQVKARGRIIRPTALLIDKSGSMSEAIELGKRLGAMISAVCDSELYVYAFDTIAMAVEPGGKELSTWEKALKGIVANGGTSVGVGVKRLLEKRQYVEQIIVITDEGENTAPWFTDALRKYREEMKADPNVCFVKTRGASSILEQRMQEAGLPADAFQFNGDYYALPNPIPMLARPSKLEMLMEILEYPLPKRKAS